MDRLTRIEEMQNALRELKSEKPDVFKKASEYVVELSKKFPLLNLPDKEDNSDYAGSVRGLRFIIAYAYSQVGDRITPTIEGAFKNYSGKFENVLTIKRTPESIISYLYIALDNQLQKLERSHEVHILKKQGPRDVKVPKKDTDGNIMSENGEIVKEKKSILNVTIWINDMKDLASLSIWGTKKDEEEIAPEHVPYETLQVNHAYRMALNYNGKNYFPPPDPMIKPMDSFVLDEKEMVKTITEKFSEMKEPFDSPGNMDPQKMYYMIGKVTKDPSGGIIVSPLEPTNSIIQLQRTADSRLLEDGDDILVLGNIGKSKSFKGRDGKEVKSNSDFVIFQTALVKLSESSDNTVEEDNLNENDPDDMKKELGL